MGSGCEGVSPYASAHMIDTICGALRAKGVLEGFFGAEMQKPIRTIANLQPSHYLVDTYLEQSLLDGPTASARAFMVLDSTECHYLDHLSGGTWPARVGLVMPGFDSDPTWRACLAADASGVRSFPWAGESLEAACLEELELNARPNGSPCAEGPSVQWLYELLNALASLPLRAFLRGDCHHGSLSVAPVRTNVRQRFSRAPYQARLFDLLRDCGCDENRLDALVQASFAYGFPFSTADGHRGQSIVSVDLGYLTFLWDDSVLTDVRAGVLITDRSVSFDSMMLKPMIVYQWHITDNCDQRCKHCYLFAEDAQAHCLSTPWDKLMHTLDEIEDVAMRRHLIPMLAVSGGDPILHPRFWDFAAELKRRGIRWSGMGNPFHLDADVSRRLRQAGCTKYQLSLDGLERFHDHLRKPGSFRATLAAIEPLRSAGIKVQLMATASRENLDDILACMDVAVEHEADSFAFARYCATSPQKAAEFYPSPEEYRAFLLAYWNKKRAYEQAGCKTAFKTKDHLFRLLRWELGAFRIPELSRRYPDHVCGGCHLGSKSTIAVNGDLLACRRMGSVVGNVWVDHLYDVDEGPAMKAYAKVSDIKKCRDCELLMWCRGCRAVGYNATGDLQAADPMCWKA